MCSAVGALGKEGILQVLIDDEQDLPPIIPPASCSFRLLQLSSKLGH